MQEREGDEERAALEGGSEWMDYDPPPLALEHLQEFEI